MGTKSKKGKNRLDSFQKLAKTVGQRSRASFKLLQINSKYKLLENSSVVLDLCCAPGSWMQVCLNKMSVSSCILGVDLVKIKSITGCDFQQGDITHESTCEQIKKQLGNKNKVCLILNDGSPNVGGAFSTESFQQAELCIHSLRICQRFLKKGGNFVSKIFRSKEYRNVMYVAKQLFEKVQAVKPKASRESSAEIQLVCIQQKDDKNFDVKLLEVDNALKSLDDFEFDEEMQEDFETVKTMSTNLTKSQKSSLSNVSRVTDMSDASGQLANPGELSKINSIKKMIQQLDSRKKHGYTDDITNKGKLMNVPGTLAALISASNPYLYLCKHTSLTLPQDEEGKESLEVTPDVWKKNKKLFGELREQIKDLRLCGPSDFRQIIKWRTFVRDHMTNNELKDSLKRKRDDGNAPKSDEDKKDKYSVEYLMDMKEKEEKKKVKAEKKRTKEFNKKYREMIETGQNMDHFYQDEDVYDPQDEREPEATEESMTSLSHHKMKQLTMNKKSWFNQDIFKEINLSIDEYQDKKTKSEVTNKPAKLAKINKNPEPKKDIGDDASSQEDASESDDEAEHYDAEYSKPIIAKLMDNKNIKENVCQSKEDKDDDEASDDELVLKSTQDPNSLKQARKDKLREKREREEERTNKRHDQDPNKIEIVPQTDVSSKQAGKFDEDDSDDEDLKSGRNKKKRYRDEESVDESEIEDEDENSEREQKNKVEQHKNQDEQEDSQSESDDQILKDKSNKSKTNKSKDSSTINNNSADIDSDETDADEDTIVNRLAIAKKMLRKKDKHRIIDESQNRWQVPEDEDAPLWFLKEDRYHWCPNPIISRRDKHQVRLERDPSIEEKTMKKVLEAKMRRKKRLTKKLDKIKKKGSQLAENDGDSNNRVLNAGLRKIQTDWNKTKRDAKGTRKGQTVVTKGKTNAVSGQSKKGTSRVKQKLVDARMKKDKRNDKKRGVDKNKGGNKKSNGQSLKRKRK